MNEQNWYRSLKGYKYATEIVMQCDVEISEEDGNEYIWLSNGTLTISEHYAWDGASGPTIDGPTNMRASLFHDALCQLIRENLLDKKYRKYADELFYKHLLEDKMKPWRAWCYYQGVRAWSKWKGM